MVSATFVEEIPATAVEVKVTSVSSPSLMKIYDKDNYSDRLDDIGRSMRLLMKRRSIERFDKKSQPRVGDLVITHYKFGTNLMLPAWWVRGLLGSYDEKSCKYNVFMVDHGFTIQVSRSNFAIVPKSRLNVEYLISSVGMNNLIPAFPRGAGLSDKENIGLSKEWSVIAIEITKDCIAESSKTYFDYQTVDDNGMKYGELYLVIENKIVSLSEILISKKLAIYLTEDVTRPIKSLRSDNTCQVDSSDRELIVEIKAKSLECPRKHRIIVDETNDTCSETKEMIVSPTNSNGDKSMQYLRKDCQEILVHSNIRCERLKVMADARLSIHIHKALQRQSIIAFRKIQSYMCPAVSKGLNVLAVGPPNCGKTLGYLMPIVSIVATSEKISKCKNPSLLILCSSTSEVLNVRAICAELLEVYTDIRCVAGFNGRPNRSLVADIYNGCQIFIATPPFLVRFINRDDDHKKLLNFDNLSYLVIDGIDVILNKYYDSFQQLFARHIVKARIDKRENFDKPSLQMIAVSRHWSSLLDEFTKQCMIDPYVCIGSYMEAAIYGRIKPKLHIVDSKMKMQRVKEILGDETTMIKTVIICHDTVEARGLDDFLSTSHRTLVACESMAAIEIHGIAECWKATVFGLYPILICTDDVLVDLNVTDVDWLIHYSVELPSKTQFYFRFSTLMKNLKKAHGKTKVTIIADETNDVQLHGLVTVLERCGIKLSPKFTDNVMRIVMTLDSQKKSYPICDNVKAFGCCPKKNSCSYRHCALASVDTPVTPIKIGDSVKLVVTYVHNATHFTARVMEYITPYQEVTKYSVEEYTRLSTAIHTYYADKNHRRCQKTACVGDIYGYEVTVDNFQRVKVLNIAMKDSDEIPKFVDIKCVDTGAILLQISATRLLELPEDLANRDTHIVEVFLAGIVPYDDEYEWNCWAVDDTLKWFSENTQPHSYVLGKVCLHVADTIWVDPLEIRTKVIGHRDMVSASLKRHMIQLKHAVSNDNHLSQLYELCKIGMVKDPSGENVVPATSLIVNVESDESDGMAI